MAVQIIPAINFFLPVFSFLFVFLVVYALLDKTKILGEKKFIHILVSFILAVFFVVNTSLTNYVAFNSAWFAVFIVCVLFILILVGFVNGKLDVIQKPWVAWLLVVGLIVFFIISSSHVFQWSLNTDLIEDWFDTDWFGFVLLLLVAGAASWILSKSK